MLAKTKPRIKTCPFTLLLENEGELSRDRCIDREAEAHFRCRPAVRMSGFHPGDPRSIPGNGNVSTFVTFPNSGSLFDQILPFLFFVILFDFPKL